jgi:hypothetical protein
MRTEREVIDDAISENRVPEYLAWPSYRATREVRLNNMMLRMLEVPLMKTKSDLEASKMLVEVFSGRFKARKDFEETAIKRSE